MKYTWIFLILAVTSCSSSKKIRYLQNLPETSTPQYFPYEMPDYLIQYRDILYIDIKVWTVDGKIQSLLNEGSSAASGYYMQNETAQYISGYSVDKSGNITLPAIGKIPVSNKALPEVKGFIQTKIDSVFKHAYVDVKLLSFKYTVLGEVKQAGTYVNYNNYLTVFEAIGRAGGVGDFGRRDRVLVVRPTDKGTTTYRIDLRDKNILTSQAYFVMPNDVVIIEPLKSKIFNLNIPTYAFTITSVTSAVSTVLLLINFLKK